VEQICDDLAAEHHDLDRVVADLDVVDWDRPTPAVGWSVRDEISHLGFFDRTAVAAVTDPEAFAAGTAALVKTGGDPSVAPGRSMAAAELLAWWRTGREDLLRTLRGLDARQRIPWYGPPMAARSFATARLMETWAHGQDVVDALGVVRPPTDRLRHVAHLGVRARPFSYANRGLPLPERPVTVVLRGPGGDTWTWDDEARDVVRGEALDFCLVVTRRRHLDDTGLEVVGAGAKEWMGIAQAFAGPPGPGRAPGGGVVTGR
jgi:uncharacterized protein (TIGR03084 family)